MSIPNHLAIIPDGNRRWAKAQGLAAPLGHRRGAKTTERILTAAVELGIRYLTFWGASVNNLTKRSATEVAVLKDLFADYFGRLLNNKTVHERQVRVEVLGRWQELMPKNVITAAQKAMAATARYNAFTLTILLGYNGTDEMTQAAAAIAELARQDQKLVVTPELIKANLWTKSLPAVDLLIRTAGEPHLSTGFMMWDIAEAELYFTKALWPDFSVAELKQAIIFYESRERRLGK